MQYETTGLPLFPQMTALGEVVQVYSHFRLEATVYHYDGKHKPLPSLPAEGQWVTHEEIANLPLSQVDKKILQLAGIA